MARALSDGRRGDLLHIDSVALDSVTRILHANGFAPVRLTPIEFRLLRCLMDQPGECISKTDLLDRVWGYPPEGGADLVRQHVSNLRRKLREVGQDALVETVSSHGYTFVPPGNQTDLAVKTIS